MRSVMVVCAATFPCQSRRHCCFSPCSCSSALQTSPDVFACVLVVDLSPNLRFPNRICETILATSLSLKFIDTYICGSCKKALASCTTVVLFWLSGVIRKRPKPESNQNRPALPTIIHILQRWIPELRLSTRHRQSSGDRRRGNVR
jgi:hypothetical protein